MTAKCVEPGDPENGSMRESAAGNLIANLKNTHPRGGRNQVQTRGGNDAAADQQKRPVNPPQAGKSQRRHEKPRQDDDKCTARGGKKKRCQSSDELKPAERFDEGTSF